MLRSCAGVSIRSGPPRRRSASESGTVSVRDRGKSSCAQVSVRPGPPRRRSASESGKLLDNDRGDRGETMACAVSVEETVCGEPRRRCPSSRIPAPDGDHLLPPARRARAEDSSSEPGAVEGVAAASCAASPSHLWLSRSVCAAVCTCSEENSWRREDDRVSMMCFAAVRRYPVRTHDNLFLKFVLTVSTDGDTFRGRDKTDRDQQFYSVHI
mmetsp:Transcript_29393/g.45391  ORF Transcript_29393/g.45391 Transcript_29393/m.45391 type:complete len:212 (-) Transcript_29393:209-844(-)